jgi:hypothetical protein
MQFLCDRVAKDSEEVLAQRLGSFFEQKRDLNYSGKDLLQMDVQRICKPGDYKNNTHARTGHMQAHIGSVRLLVGPDRAHASTHRNRPSACWTGPGTCNDMSVSFQFCVEPVGSRACWTQSNHTTSHLLHLPLSTSPMMMINTVLASRQPCRVCRREEPPVIRCPSLQINWQMQKLCQRM